MVLPWRKRVAFVEGGRAEGLVRSVDGLREKVTAAAEAKDGRSAGASQMIEESMILKRQWWCFNNPRRYCMTETVLLRTKGNFR